MRNAIFVLEMASVLGGAIRYLRIAQREHYLAFSVTKFAYRWYKNKFSYLFLILAVALGLISIKFWFSSLIGVLILALLPIGLTYRGTTSKLVYTRRLVLVYITLITLYIVLSAALLTAIQVKFLGICVVALGIILPVFVDIALVIDAPIENRLSQRYLSQAEAKLKTISPTVIGITGSYGKTSTKVLSHHYLSQIEETVMSPKSFNNKNGLTRTVLENLHGTAKVLVAEMGTYGKGEIKQMVSWLKPKVAALVSVGPVHLERMKTLNNILEAKSEIFEFAEYAVLNIDDELVASLEGSLIKAGIRVCRCSSDINKLKTADVMFHLDKGEAVLYLGHQEIGKFRYDLSKPPPINVAVAIGISLYFEIQTDTILQMTESLPEVDHRATVTVADNGIIIVDDTFNSNPAGAELALNRAIKYLKSGSSLYVVTPGMVEMGSLQAEANSRFAAQISGFGGKVIAVKNTNKKALLSSGDDCLWLKDRDSATKWIRNNCRSGDVILFENDLPDHYP